MAPSTELTTPDPYPGRGRYFDLATAFYQAYPEVAAVSFAVEDRALEPATGTALIACDWGLALGLEFSATSPPLLACYARVSWGASRKA